MDIKLTEKEKEELYRYFQNPAFQMTPRHALYTAHKIKSMQSLKQKKKEAIKFASDESFLFNFSHDYFFYRYVRKTEMRKEWYWNQIREIGYLILLDLLHPEKATPTESWKKPKHSAINSNSSSSDWLGERQLRRIREDYPEIFFTPHDCRQNNKDQRQTRYLTVFSDLPLENDEAWPLALEILAAQDIDRAPFMDDIMRVRQVIAGLRMVDPEDLIGLQRFWLMQKKSLEIITAKYQQSTHHKWLSILLKEKTNMLEHMYQFIDKAVALRWFRTIKSEQKKERVLKEKKPWTYTEDDAKKAVELTFKWFENSATATDTIFRGASAYAYLSMFNVALSLYEECLKQPLLEMTDKGLCCHNIADTYRQMGEPEKCLDWLQKTLAVFREQGSKFDIGVTWAYIAEANLLLGNMQEYKEAKNQSKTILSMANISDLLLTDAYLYIADCAQRTKDRSWEREALTSGLRSASKLEDFEKATYISQRIGDLDTGKSTFEAEQEPGKLKRPPVLRWNTSLIHYSAIAPKLKGLDEKKRDVALET